MALAHLHAANDPENNVDLIGGPFGDPDSSQYDVVPNLSVPASPGPTVEDEAADTDPMRSQAFQGLMKGSAEELHLRNASRRPPPSRLSPGSDGDDDILVELSKQPVDQRLLALEQYTVEQHSCELFPLNLKVRTLENKMTLVLGQTDIVGAKAKKCDVDLLVSRKDRACRHRKGKRGFAW